MARATKMVAFRFIKEYVMQSYLLSKRLSILVVIVLGVLGFFGWQVVQLQAATLGPTLADLEVYAGINQTLLFSGDTLSINADIFNAGPDTAFDSTLLVQFSDGMTLLPPINCMGNGVGNSVTYSLGDLVAFDYVPCAIQFEIDADYAGIISATISISSLTNDPDSSNNLVELTFSVTRPRSITIIKEAVPQSDTDFSFSAPDNAYYFQKKMGGFGEGNGSFSFPAGIAYAPDGSFYVADAGNDLVQHFDSDGNFINQWGSNGGGDGQFSGLNDVAVDTAGNVYVADTNNGRVQKFSSNGTYLAQFGQPLIGWAWGITLDSTENVYVADNINNMIWKFDNAGILLTSWAISSTNGIASSPDNFIYNADANNEQIVKYDTDGNVQTSWKIMGTTANNYLLSPFAIDVDTVGNVYVSETDIHANIQKYDASGQFITSWGRAGSGDGFFGIPEGLRGIAVAPDGNVVVVDGAHHRLQFFGTGDFMLNDDGDPARNSVTYTQIPTGTYHFEELLTTEYDFVDIQCETNDVSDPPIINQNNLTIDLNEEESIVCTFRNQRDYYLYLPILKR
jgi:sugar lactone lactonase YvrE